MELVDGLDARLLTDGSVLPLDILQFQQIRFDKISPCRDRKKTLLRIEFQRQTPPSPLRKKQGVHRLPKWQVLFDFSQVCLYRRNINLCDRFVIALAIIIHAAHRHIIGGDDPGHIVLGHYIWPIANNPSARGKVRLMRPSFAGQRARKQAFANRNECGIILE